MAEAIVRQRFSATDPDEATRAVRAVFGNGSVRSERGMLRFEQVSAVDDGISVSRITSGGEHVRLETGTPTELVVIAVRDGHLDLTSGETTVPLEAGALGLVPMGRAMQVSWNAVVFDAFLIGSSSLGRMLGVENQGVRLRAPRLTPRSRELALLWDRVSRVLAGVVLEAPDLYERDLVRDQMIDALTATTIEAFDLSNDTEFDVDRDDEALRRAERFMRRNLAEPLTVPDIARAAGVSLRGLQLLYQRRMASTPILHLRRLRLEAARAVLQARRADDTVTSVARRFGYGNVGRFGAHYRAEFDESPSTTFGRR